MTLVGYGFVGQAAHEILKRYGEVKIIDPAKGYPECYADNEIYYIAIDPGLDFSGLYDVLDKIKERLNPIVVIESTLSMDALRTIEWNYRFPIIYVPERVQPGGKKASVRLYATLHCDDPEDADEAIRPIRDNYDLIEVGPEQAVITKLTENAYRYFQIAFANLISESFGEEVVGLVNTHQNVKLMQPGIGIGGLCLEKDTDFFLDALPRNETLEELYKFGKKIPSVVAGNIEEEILISNVWYQVKTISVFGKAYKPNTNITTNSKALEIAEKLRTRYEVLHYDPLIDAEVPKGFFHSDWLVVLVGHAYWEQYAKMFRKVIDARSGWARRV